MPSHVKNNIKAMTDPEKSPLPFRNEISTSFAIQSSILNTPTQRGNQKRLLEVLNKTNELKYRCIIETAKKPNEGI